MTTSAQRSLVSSRPGFIYFVGDTKYVKIGWSRDEPGVFNRLKAQQLHNPRPVELLAYFAAPRGDEGLLHRLLHEARVRGEWFRVGHKAVQESIRSARAEGRGLRLSERVAGFGGRLRALREHRRVTRKQLCCLAVMRPGTLDSAEQGKLILSNCVVERIADELGCSKWWLLFGWGKDPTETAFKLSVAHQGKRGENRPRTAAA